MKYIDLIKEIPEEDKKNMLSYIDEYGIAKEEFIGLEAWLSNWSHANQKLYKFLGNTLIKKYPFNHEKTPEELEREISRLVNTHSFIEDYRYRLFSSICLQKNNINITTEQQEILIDYSRTSTFIRDKIEKPFKYKIEGKPTLQLQAGMKPIRALGKIVEYFKGYLDISKTFEDFRIAHSMIFNDKNVKGNLCFSIHPFDFITMSDNSANWSSCMSWMDNGCYHAGTIEMMNSNNVACCYIESENNKFNFAGKYSQGEWNNKRWRQLLYVTKDILMTGKAYPYIADEISKDILEKAKKLAEDNMNWHYSFGIERYNDMKHIDTYNKMRRNKEWIQIKNTTKHNIIWDTKGMYNDMFNDQTTKYWCYRNKVNSNKMISISGKCNCLKCNNDIVYFEDDSDYYNERYTDAGSHLCPDCKDMYCCDICSRTNSHLHHTEIVYLKRSGGKYCKEICEDCFNKYVKKCPCCGKPMFANGDYTSMYRESQPSLIFDKNNAFLGNDGMCSSYIETTAEFLYICDECILKKLDMLHYTPVTIKEWRYDVGYKLHPALALTFKSDTYAEQFKYCNLKSVPYTGEVLEVMSCYDGITSEIKDKTPHFKAAFKELAKHSAA